MCRSKGIWDPELYERFKGERAQPFFDLLSRIPDMPVRFAADLGCGTGELTRFLLKKWPEARIWGVDSSAEMLEKARNAEPDPRLVFVQGDLQHWRSPQPLDCIFSNAAFHWVSDHAKLLQHLAAQLSPGGVLAAQIPNNRGEAAFRLAAELVGSPRWASRIPASARQYTIESCDWYLERLRELQLEAEVWETLYYHQLPDAHAVLEWLEGAALRPILSTLAPEEASELLSQLGAGISEHYKAGRFGVVFPFRRLFFLARRGEE
jgi:trans-aconitate 2-methyltransferase